MEISLKAENIFSIGNYHITNGLILALIVSLILIVFAVIFRKKIKMVPGLVQGAVEMIMEVFLNLMESVLGSKEKAEKYLPIVLTIFVFILTSNWMGILPGVGSIVYNEGGIRVPLFRSPAADLNFTLAFAVMAVIVTNFFGVTILGFFTHFKKFLNFSSPVNFFVGILEFLSEMAKFISFSFRLFGNIFAGEVLLTIMFFLLPYIVPIPFMMLELFFGAIQAFVFAMLTLVFLTLHTTEHGAEHEKAH
ncbi:MAG: F0F1 ATP synthase subunit A [Candidatus Staskawiczbacteria bacterium]|nr:F0F1 ATP synthase subunit A [Candidatus Staskawiczbacteria bacterium]